MALDTVELSTSGKRRRNSCPSEEPSAKRRRTTGRDRLSSLSDEIILHILSFLPIPSIVVCQRLSRRLNILAGDRELWKRKYYTRWILPRARRIRRITPGPVASDSLKMRQWLDKKQLVFGEKDMDWKTQYRLRHNWSIGACRIREVEVGRQPAQPILAKLFKGIIFSADVVNGLRAWTIKSTDRPLATVSFSPVEGQQGRLKIPTAVTVTSDEKSSAQVTVGFESGEFAIYLLNCSTAELQLCCFHLSASERPLIALASSASLLLTLSTDQRLSLYRLHLALDSSKEESGPTQLEPELITSLGASTVLAPVSLSIRTTKSDIIASVAYSFSRIGCGWSMGLQELHFSHNGEYLESRVATTVDSQYGSLQILSPAGRKGTPRYQNMISSGTNYQMKPGMRNPLLSYTQPPTSLSYSHPYLLASHADNTLTMYIVVSTPQELSIKTGRRLWGHTSSVSGVEVSHHGKAVSVSSRGDEIRVWELEDLITSHSTSRRSAIREDNSVQIMPQNRDQPPQFLDLAALLQETAGKENLGVGINFSTEEQFHEQTRMQGWITFDEEQIVVLREQVAVGKQLLGYYDFT